MRDVRELARRGTTQLGSRAGEVGAAIGSRARDLGGTVGSRAADLGGTIGERARDVRTAAAPRARDLRKDLGKRTRRTRKRVGYWIAGEKPKRRTLVAVAAAGAGAVAAFFLDPATGKRRRAVTRDWLRARVRGLSGRGARAGREIGERAAGLRERVVHLGEEEAPTDDRTLESKVERELFRQIDLPSREISIMVARGMVSLRGAVDRPDRIAEIERLVRRVKGVRDVENLLHLRDTPAPSRP